MLDAGFGAVALFLADHADRLAAETAKAAHQRFVLGELAVARHRVAFQARASKRWRRETLFRGRRLRSQAGRTPCWIARRASASAITTKAEVTSGPPTRIRVGVFILFHS